MLTLRKLLEVRFYRNILSLMSASVVSQLIVLVSTPLLTKIYSPESFGEFALFLLYTNFFVAFISLRIEWSIPSARTSTHAKYLVLASIKVAFFFSIFISVIFFFGFQEPIFKLFNLKEVKLVMLIAPSSFIMITVAILTANFVRQNDMLRVSYSLVIQSISNLFVSLYAGIIGLLGVGLIVSQSTSSFLSLLYLSWRESGKTRYFVLSKVRLAYLRSYKTQITNSLMVSLLNFFFQNSFPIILSINYSTREIGLYYLAARIAGAPISTLSAGLANSFWGEVSLLASQDLREARRFYLHTSFKLLILSVPVSILYIVLSEYISYIFTDDKWSELGAVIFASIPLFIASLIFSSTNHLIVYNKQHYQLLTDATLVLCMIAVIFISSSFNWFFLTTIAVMSWITFLLYLLRFFLHLKANTEAQLTYENI